MFIRASFCVIVAGDRWRIHDLPYVSSKLSKLNVVPCKTGIVRLVTWFKQISWNCKACWWYNIEIVKNVLYIGKKSLPIASEQPMNGSPTNPGMHVQTGLWFITAHVACWPHEPGHGSRHFWFTHANWLAHSGFIRHSGLQLGGIPI